MKSHSQYNVLSFCPLSFISLSEEGCLEVFLSIVILSCMHGKLSVAINVDKICSAYPV